MSTNQANTALFSYSRRQRTMAKRITLNMILLMLMYVGLVQFDDGSESYAELITVSGYALIAVELLLLVLVIYFWRNNKAFTITLTPHTLTLFDPMFGDFSWQVTVADIQEIKHSFNAHTQLSRIEVIMNNQSKQTLTMNYPYSRTDLYAELAKLNPHIVMPKSAYVFPKTNQG